MYAGYTVGCGGVVELDGVTAEVEEEFARCRSLPPQRSNIRIASDPVEQGEGVEGPQGGLRGDGRISPDYFVQDGVIPQDQAGAAARMRQMSEERALRSPTSSMPVTATCSARALQQRGAGRGRAGRAPRDGDRGLCVDQGGSITGEHGVGSDKACSMLRCSVRTTSP